MVTFRLIIAGVVGSLVLAYRGKDLIHNLLCGLRFIQVQAIRSIFKITRNGCDSHEESSPENTNKMTLAGPESNRNLKATERLAERRRARSHLIFIECDGIWFQNLQPLMSVTKTANTSSLVLHDAAGSSLSTPTNRLAAESYFFLCMLLHVGSV